MKKLLIIAAIIAPLLATTATARNVSVRGYTRSNGTYVAPSHRTAPNSTRTDNWSSKPNVNPYTGKAGTVDPYTPKTKK